MPTEQTEYVEPLCGPEIIEDILDQIRERLQRDCFLSREAAYPGGYSGQIDIDLKLHGIDAQELKTKIVMGIDKPADEKTHEIKEKVEISVEQRLNVVRQRSGQDVPTLTTGEDGRPEVKKRHYGRPAPEVKRGAATGETLETE